MQYSVVHHRYHVVHYILRTKLFYNCQFVLLTPFTYFARPPPLKTANLFSVESFSFEIERNMKICVKFETTQSTHIL